MTSASPKGWMAALALALLSSISVAGELLDRDRAAMGPTEEDLRAAINEIREGWEDGDGVVVVPSWWEAPWQQLVGVGPDAEEPPFPGLLNSPRLDPVALMQRKRVWILSAWGKPPRHETVGRMLGDAEHTANHGDTVQTARYTTGSGAPIAQLTGHLEALTVERHLASGEIRPCPRKRDRFQCGLDPWLDVRIEHRDVADHHVRWLYAHPGPGTGELVLRWDQPPATAHGLLQVGHTQAAVRRDNGAPVTIKTLVAGELLDEVALGLHAYTLHQRSVHFPADRPQQLEFRIASQDPHWREVMLQFSWLTEDHRALDSVAPKIGP